MSSKQFESNEVSMIDVLEEDKELEEEANAVFGDSDDQNCTYVKGYVKRQALYACLTCTPATPDSASAGVCLACSLLCHDDHELVELYTKRNFRCDCGNDKFPDFNCRLEKIKDPINVHNKYNQNFKGVYCLCHRPYPDPEDEIEDEMIQCICCEDWFHSRHLGNLPPFDGDYTEMICDHCMEKNDFLCVYRPFSIPSQELCTIRNGDTSNNVDVEENKLESKHFENNSADLVRSRSNADVVADKEILRASENNIKRKLVKNQEDGDRFCEGTSSKKFCDDENYLRNKNESCIFEKLSKNVEKKLGCTFWNNGWRSRLCTCEDCKRMYKEKDVEFLIDESDTIKAYEDRGQSRRENQSSSYDSGLNALNNLGRVQQIEILHGYHDMKNQLTSYLADFAREGKTVTKEDIESFFEELQAKRKKDSHILHHCR